MFRLLHFSVVGETLTRKEALGYLALMETPASHPLSDAIVEAAAAERVELPNLQLQNYTSLPGEGITANVAGKEVHVGNKRLLQRLGHYDRLPPDVRAAAETQWEKSGGTVGFMSVEGEGIVAAFCVVDEVHEEAEGAVRALRSMGIEVAMLTGDQHATAASVGERLGLDDRDVASDLLPIDKAAEVAGRAKEHRRRGMCCGGEGGVMMVGDGVDDMSALSAAGTASPFKFPRSSPRTRD